MIRIAIQEPDIKYKSRSVMVENQMQIPAWILNFPICDNCKKPILNIVLALQALPDQSKKVYYIHRNCLEKCD